MAYSDGILLANESPISRIDLLRANKNLIDLKSLCPLSKVSTGFTHKEAIIDEIRHILFSMNIFDELFTEMTGFMRHIYILGDGTIFNFLAKNIVHKDIHTIDKSYYLEIICTLGLSYRFNVARKFGYGDTNVMQLRLNGWGRAYCLGEENINDYIQLRKEIYSHWLSIISEYKKEYIELTKYCDSTERPLNIDKIHAINKRVPIKLVT